MRVLLLTPPMVQLNTPYPATPFLTAFLRSRGIAAVQEDFSLGLVLRLFSAAGLLRIAAELKRKASPVPASDAVRFFLEHLPAYDETIEPVVAFLQERNPSLAARIAPRRWLPEGPRFRILDTLAGLQPPGGGDPLDRFFGALGVQDRARYLASLYLDDLADVIRDGVDARFGFARYGERLAVSAPELHPLLEALRAAPTLVDRLLDALTREALRRHRPSLVAITAPFPGTLYGAFRIARRIKALAPTARTVLGGGYVSTELRRLSDPRVFDFFDYVVLDDGEIPLLRLLRQGRGRRPARLVRTFFRAGGRVRFCDDPAAPGVRHARRPAPSHAGLPMRDYLPLKESLNPMQSLWSDTRWNKLMLAHGCYWRRCAFCDTSLPYICRYDPAPVDVLLRWIRRVIAETGRSGFHFVDEALAPALLRSLSRRLLDAPLPITWWGNIRFEKTFTRELADLMARAGCVAVTAALETASDRTLQLMQKGITLRQAARAARCLSAAGIMVHAYLMYGFPTQTEQEIVDALEFVRQLFAASLIRSAYWHRFALTVHSPICREPQRFGVRIPPLPRAPFARNEILFSDAVERDDERMGPALHKAVYNYMHGVGLDEPVRAWFDRPVPRPTLPSHFVARAVADARE